MTSIKAGPALNSRRINYTFLFEPRPGLVADLEWQRIHDTLVVILQVAQCKVGSAVVSDSLFGTDSDGKMRILLHKSQVHTTVSK